MPKKVWETFFNTEKYRTWNPFIKSLTGNLEVGKQITVVLQPPGGREMTFKPKVLVFDKNKEFRWLGKIFIKGFFDGEHYFQFIDNQDGTTTFVHGEKF
ncbi:MAG: SRPBCC domain-containing protein, partial [Marinirhabdus sp.]